MGRTSDPAQLKPAMLRECAYQAVRIATAAEAVSDLKNLFSDVPREERVLPDVRCCGKANRPVPSMVPGGSKSVEVKSKIVWSPGAMSKPGQRPSVSARAA
jgi:hypothetical protein